MRKKRKSNPRYSNSVMRVLGDNYNLLKSRINESDLYENIDGRTLEDVFEECILYVSQDVKAKRLSEKKLIAHFLYRYNMLRFKAMRSKKCIINSEKL